MVGEQKCANRQILPEQTDHYDYGWQARQLPLLREGADSPQEAQTQPQPREESRA